MGLAFF